MMIITIPILTASKLARASFRTIMRNSRNTEDLARKWFRQKIFTWTGLYCIKTAKFVRWLQLQTVLSVDDSFNKVQPSLDHEPLGVLLRESNRGAIRWSVSRTDYNQEELWGLWNILLVYTYKIPSVSLSIWFKFTLCTCWSWIFSCKKKW